MEPLVTFNDLSFYFKPESIVMEYRNQYIAFHSYNQKDKNKLRNFGSQILSCETIQIEEVWNLAYRLGVPSVATQSASVRPTSAKLKEQLAARNNQSRIQW